MWSFHYIKRTVPFSAPIKTKLSVYVACVQSILLYNSCVWNPKMTLLKKMEKSHKKAVKWVSGRDNYVAALLTLRILPICYQCNIRPEDTYRRRTKLSPKTTG